jgi:hypothetical protein
MKKWILFFVFIVCVSLYSQTAIQPSGSGTEASPYLIGTLENLYWVSQNPGSWNSWFRQTADIDAADTATWNPNEAGGYYGWSPIGTEAVKFTGRYNGNHYTIRNLYINRPVTDYIGFIGFARNPDTHDGRPVIYQLGLLDVNFTGRDFTGALIGRIYGWYDGTFYWPTLYRAQIYHCYSTGSVTGRDYTGGLIGFSEYTLIYYSFSTCDVIGAWRVGGLLGAIRNYTIAYCCYSIGAVDGNQDVGGLVGYVTWYVNLNACYSSGYVDNGTNIGGLVGIGSDASQSQCYWDTETSGRVTSYLGTGKTTAQLKQQNYGSDWDFTNTWWMEVGQTRPLLRGARKVRIFTPHQLQLMKSNLASSYTLMRDIDLSCIQNPADVWGTIENAEGGFVPIGTSADPFTGTLNGNGYNLDGLYINRNSVYYNGLFGYSVGATIENLGVTNVNITGSDYTGGLVGKIDTSSCISSSYSTGSVSGTWFLGGLVGESNSSSINNSYSTVIVSGTGNRVGGLAGMIASSSNINNSYSMGIASGQSFVGGFAGYHSSSIISNSFSTGNVSNTGTAIGGFTGYNSSSAISNCYSTGSIDGYGDVGGFVGSNNGTPISNSFWDAETDNLDGTSSGSTNFGATGKITSEMKTQSTFTDAGWDFTDIWEMYAGYNDGYPYLQWQYSAPTQPAIPENVQISISEGVATITWNEVSEATSYKIYSSEDLYADFSSWTLEVDNIIGLFWTDENATEMIKFYVVVAVN